MDGVKAPKPWDRVEEPMCNVETEIGDQEDLEQLEPYRLSGERRVDTRRHQRVGRVADRRDDRDQAELDERAVRDDVCQVREPGAAEDSLRASRGEELLERNKNE